MFPRECCGGGRTRSYSASCLSIRLTRPRVWSLLFMGAETLVISQFSYNAVLRGRGLSRFSPVRCQFVRAGRAMRCAVALGEGEKWLWCICQETAEQCGGLGLVGPGAVCSKENVVRAMCADHLDEFLFGEEVVVRSAF